MSPRPKLLLFGIGILTGLTTFGLAHAARIDGLSFYDECASLVVDLIELPCRAITNLKTLPERMNPTWRENQ